VVIPARNDGAGLPTAVRSSLAQSGVHVAQVLVCVGPSTDDTRAVAENLSLENAVVRVLENPAGGISDALNVGLAEVTSDVLVRVDARCNLAPDYAMTALRCLAETGAANAGAVQVPVGHTPVQRAIAFAMAHTLGSGGAAYRAGKERSAVETAFLGVFKTDALRAIGGWDTSFARNEDAELNRRLILAGHEIWVDPALRVDYEPRKTLRALGRQYLDYGWWRSRMVVQHRTLRPRQLAAPIIVLGFSGGVVLGLTVSPWFLVVPASYLVGLSVAAAVTASELPASERVYVPLAWATMHLTWGAGFLASLARGSLGRARHSG